MNNQNENKALWSGRFASSPAEIMQQFSQSIDMDWRFYKHDIIGNKAQAKMLTHIGILTTQELEQILSAFDEIEKEIHDGTLIPKIALEDVHMNIEARLIEKLGPLGAKIHTGRSRNDQVATDYRLFMKDAILLIQEKMTALLKILIEKANADVDIIVPGFTHLQHAQPISLGHYWMAYFWKFNRDLKRFTSAYETTNFSPLGAGALAGSTLPIDREFTKNELNFAFITENSLDTVSDRDYLLEFLFAASTFALHTSRLCEDLIIWGTSEFNFIELPDAFCTGSSMMPNKKNPDALEIARGKTSGILSSLYDLMVNMKGLPLTYNRDLQEDKRPVFHSIETVNIILDVLTPLISEIQVKEEEVKKHLNKGFLLATDVAEYLVLKGVPFRDTHHIVGNLVQYCIRNNKDLENLTIEEWKNHHEIFDNDIFDILTPESAVDRRSTYGGTARSEVRRQIEKAKSLLK
ncbi:argininosuccinate lyase [Serpentinicella alkaliphila]|uniref:Argininosuccinate lyase n=1 Tax=Serpentinicella alkaliphila TaxID=1734049 RepID=A0A4R2UA96_9FIRM|nr:argininosuccinate lyase [Serpentinicella alkaliphila]QUH25296.1 argininosuccinate lyase [Serpentinicella alkaliphila]TCQ07109.1 argininosuccinate lyase [Serpentinicella alkaliphila]